MNNFRVGQKVVCVDAAPSFGDSTGLKEGHVYTIRWIGWDTHPLVGRDVRVLVEGIERLAEWNGQSKDWPFRTTRFRPVVERKTDISIFTRMLTPNHERVE